MGIWDYSATRDSNAIIVPGNLRTKDKDIQQIINAIRQLMADLKTFGGTVPNVLPLDGIQFPATEVVSSDVNTLYDFERGNWTPVIRFGGSGFGITYSTQTGRYVKIANLVWAGCQLIMTNKGTATGAASLEGFPFTAAGSINYAGMIQIASGAVFTGLIAGLSIHMGAGGTAASFRAPSTGGATAVSDANFLNNSQFYAAVLYTTV